MEEVDKKITGHTRRGKWSEKGVPHKGWTCVGIEDLGEPSQICEMCESMEIRYVHHMEHKNYADILSVGCVCAEHMEEDTVAPRAREKLLKSSVRRRKTWSKRVWKISAKGNHYLNVDGYNITVYRAKAAWNLTVVNRITQKSQSGRKAYPSQEHAMAAGFDALLWAKGHL